MDSNKFAELQSSMSQRCITIAAGKTADYSSLEDVFQSFKIGSAVVAALDVDVKTPRGDALYNIVKKLIRLCSLESKCVELPVNEPIEDTVRDLHVYLDLYYGMYVEEKDQHD